jgi:hypothetical protein
LLHDNAPAYRAASVCQFFTQQKITTLCHPVLSKFISARLFSVPQVENKVKRTPIFYVTKIQKAVTDELKRTQKEKISAAFQKLYDGAKACIYANVAYFE